MGVIMLTVSAKAQQSCHDQLRSIPVARLLERAANHFQASG